VVKHSRNKFVALLTIAFLSLSSPLTFTSNSWAQKATDTKITPLIEQLKNDDEWEREQTLNALKKIGKPAVSALTEAALKNEDWRVRQGAIEALQRIAAIPDISVPLKALKDGNVKVRRRAAKMLMILSDSYKSSQIGFYSFFLSGSLKEEEVKPVNTNLRAAIPELITALKDKDPGVRRMVASVLWNMNTEAKAAVPALIAALKDKEAIVRSGAADALGHMGEAAYNKPELIAALKNVAVSALIVALKDKEAIVRRSAADALGDIRAEAAVPALIVALKDKDKNVRHWAASALGSIGKEAKAAVPALIAALKDKDTTVRSSAALALGSIGKEAKDAVPALIATLKDKDTIVRSSAAEALGKIGVEANLVPNLIATLKDEDKDVRSKAASALGSIGKEAKAAVPDLIATLKDKDTTVRSSAASALGSIGKEAKAAVPDLSEALKDKDENVRRNAASALGSIGKEAKAAVPALSEALKDKDESLRGNAASALKKIAISLQDKANVLPLLELDRVILNLEAALKILEDPQAKFSMEQIADMRLLLDALKDKRRERIFNQAILQNPWVWGTGIYLVSLLGIFWLRPLWLLKIDRGLKPIVFKLPVLGAEISPRFLLFLKHHPRVLDAWVVSHLKSVREKFPQKDTVRERKVHIPIPVILDGHTVAELTGKNLRSTFNKHLLIWGEGGAGKTSLGCEIAKWAMSEDQAERLCQHRMLPVLIEQDLDSEAAAGKQPFIAAIQGQLQDLTDEPEPICEELLQRLLRRRRVLVIVDHFSEMSEATRKAIRPELPDFPVNALIVTSRIEETLGHVSKTTIKPLRIEGNRLSSFMEAYLTLLGKRDLFTDAEFFDACSRLSLMVGDRHITALLAKLYAEQLIDAKIEPIPSLPLQLLPENIPNLMLSYLNYLNRQVTEGKLDDRIVHHDTKIVAWECLKQIYRPSATKREDAITALGGDNAETRLKYLEERLRIIQTISPAKDQIRFSLDPLAEYLAGLHLLDIYGQDEQLWQQFLQAAPTMPDAPESIKGFLLAVRDCCLAKGKAAKVPDFVAEELGKLAGVASAAQPAGVSMQTGIAS
jgi:HEAT repeat protein